MVIRHALVAAMLGLTAAALAAGDEATPYDGSWNVTLTCPPHEDDEDAKGYVHHFPAEVKGGLLQGTHGSEGAPGYHFLSGPIARDGSARLTLQGIVNNPAYAVNQAQRGKPYVYRVRARFGLSSGTGERLGKRQCDFSFRRT